MSFCIFVTAALAVVFEREVVNIQDAGLIVELNDTFIQRLVPNTELFFRQLFQQEGVKGLMPSDYNPAAIMKLTSPAFKLSLGQAAEESMENTTFQLKAFGEVTLSYGVNCGAAFALSLLNDSCVLVSQCGKHASVQTDAVYGSRCACDSGLVPSASGVGCFCPNGGYFAPFGGICVQACDASTMVTQEDQRQCQCGQGLPVYFVDANKCRAVNFCSGAGKLLEQYQDGEGNLLCRCKKDYMPVQDASRCGCEKGKLPAPFDLGCIEGDGASMDCSTGACTCIVAKPLYFQSAGICKEASFCTGSAFMSLEPAVDGSSVQVCRCKDGYVVNAGKNDCACPQGTYLSPFGRRCIKSCDEATMITVGLTCVCKQTGTAYFHEAGKCVSYCGETGYSITEDVCACSTGFVLQQGYCVCSGGRYMTPLGDCIQLCDSSLTVDETRRRCTCPSAKPVFFTDQKKCITESLCPSNGVIAESPKACGCTGQIYFVPQQACVSPAACSGAGMVLDGSVCSCGKETPLFTLALQSCVSQAQCTAMGADSDALEGTCACKNSLLAIVGIEKTKQCGLVSAALCLGNAGFTVDQTRGYCICQGYLNKQGTLCLPQCGSLQKVDADKLHCVCGTGGTYEEASFGRACYSGCPSGVPVNGASCDCSKPPASSLMAPSLDKCTLCTGAFMVIQTINSISFCACMAGYVYDPTPDLCKAPALGVAQEPEPQPLVPLRAVDPNPELRVVFTIGLEMAFELAGLTYKNLAINATVDSEWGTTAALDEAGRKLIALVNSDAKVVPVLASWLNPDVFKLTQQTTKLSDTTYIDMRPCGVMGYPEDSWLRIQYNFVNQICVATSSLSTAICKGTYVSKLRDTAPEYIGPQPIQGFIRLAPLKQVIGSGRSPFLVYKGMAVSTAISAGQTLRGVGKISIGPGSKPGLLLSVQSICQVQYDTTARPIECQTSSVNAGLLALSGAQVMYEAPFSVGVCQLVLFPAAATAATSEEWLWFGCSLE